MENILTVSQLNSYLKTKIDNDFALKNITLKGEISNFTNHIKSGHFYFTIKDKNCAIKAVMFRTYASSVKFEVQDGMHIIATGSVRLFERDGVVQFYCEKMIPDGVGDLYLAFEQLKEKLSKEGLFNPEYKKQIPTMPKVIGVVTSKTGAALQDIINVLSRRYPIAKLVLISALVQGTDAPKSICDAIELANKSEDIDVLIVGRGGGSIEDLWAFNDENVARAIFNSKIPVVSAVGHEIDFTISDFVADLRAPTPSAAAEICSVDINEIKNNIEMKKQTLDQLMKFKLDSVKQSSDKLIKQLNLLSPTNKINQTKDILKTQKEKLDMIIEQIFKNKEKEYVSKLSLLESLSPLTVLSRGYSVTFKEDKVITSSKELLEDDLIKTKLNDGEIISKVLEVR